MNIKIKSNFFIGFLISNFIIADSLNGQVRSLSTTPVNRQPQPFLVRGPYLQAATSTSIIIRWRTNASERSIVKYGINPDSLTTVVENPKLTSEHIVKIETLTPATKYYYSIGGLTHTLQGNKDNSFTTLPLPGTIGKYRIAAFGDCGNNSTNQKSVRDQVLKYIGSNNLDSWLLLGDNAYESGTDVEYQENFFDVYKNDLLKKYPLFPAPGNHDYRDIDKYRSISQATQDVAYFQNFSMPVNGEAGGFPSNNQAYYSFDIGNIHFLSLDSYGKEQKTFRIFDTLSPQVKWLKKDLEENKNKEWVVAYWHHPPFTMASHNSDKETELVKIRENFIKILERSGVDLVLCGHSHSYERSKLMAGHYGYETTFDSSSHIINHSSGLYNGTYNSCPYIKDVNSNGIVYVVSGSAGQIDGRTQPSFPHNAMYYSNATHGGALMLEVEGNRLDGKWICADGVIRDQFTMMKQVKTKTIIQIKKGKTAALTASFNGAYKWNKNNSNAKSIVVKPALGKTTYTVQDKYNCIKEIFEVIVTR